MIFQAGNVHESAILFNLNEKEIYMKDSRNRTHDLDGPVYYATHWTTEDLLDGITLLENSEQGIGII